MWRRMHTKEYYEYHGVTNGTGLNVDEAHPFISNTNGSATGQIRTNISAARQFNQSPNFQRLNPTSTNTTTSSATHTNNGSDIGSRISNTNSLGRPRYSTNSSSNNRGQQQSYSNATMYNHNKMNRINEYMLNTDPYSMCNPSAPAPSNYFLK